MQWGRAMIELSYLVWEFEDMVSKNIETMVSEAYPNLLLSVQRDSSGRCSFIVRDNRGLLVACFNKTKNVKELREILECERILEVPINNLQKKYNALVETHSAVTEFNKKIERIRREYLNT